MTKTFVLTALVAAAGIVAPATAQESRLEELPVEFETMQQMNIDLHHGLIHAQTDIGSRGGCAQVSTYTDANFSGGSYVLQAGFAEDEVAAVAFTIPAGEFPIKLELAEMIFGTMGASVQTTTEWSFIVWEGTPGTGSIAYIFSSDDIILPHIVLPPGTNGVNVQVSVDPGDPEQIVINDNGSHTFSIGYRIDVHNNQFADPCGSAPPTASNAFPATDSSNLASPSGNWLCAVDCGPFGCPSGCTPFSGLGVCRPNHDWVIRATWSSFNCQSGVGPCCLPNGDCSVMLQSECTSVGGIYQGDGPSCAGISCPDPVAACCFGGEFGGCLDLTENNCTAAGGVWQAPGSSCSTIICFETGACCLPDGSCVDDVSPDDCASMGGTYQGVDTTCAMTDCPDPDGACCFSTGFCLELTEAECLGVGATWLGPLTTCAGDGNSNGIDDNCEAPPAECDGDTNDDNMVNFDDLNVILGAWGTGGPAGDVFPAGGGDGMVNFDDLNFVLNNWGASCP
ncbi:MAG: hypothetical protein KDA21_00750 [Phycisphaerales bacterium]|nr:hypothetical protein [Phycisphaerales bacterium]